MKRSGEIGDPWGIPVCTGLLHDTLPPTTNEVLSLRKEVIYPANGRSRQRHGFQCVNKRVSMNMIKGPL